MNSIYLIIFVWYIVTGLREGYTWAKPERRAILDLWIFDYHAWRMVEGLCVFVLVCLITNEVITPFGFWLCGNWLYEKTLRYTMDKSWHGTGTEFKIFGLVIPVRWWFYELGAIAGLILILGF